MSLKIQGKYYTSVFDCYTVRIMDDETDEVLLEVHGKTEGEAMERANWILARLEFWENCV